MYYERLSINSKIIIVINQFPFVLISFQLVSDLPLRSSHCKILTVLSSLFLAQISWSKLKDEFFCNKLIKLVKFNWSLWIADKLFWFKPLTLIILSPFSNSRKYALGAKKNSSVNNTFKFKLTHVRSYVYFK